MTANSVTLHRATNLLCSRGMWRVAGRPLLVQRDERGWTIVPLDADSQKWAASHALTDLVFPTRRAAVQTLVALFALDGGPPADPAPVRLRRVRAGLHRSECGRWEVRRDPGETRWTIVDTITGPLGIVIGTLALIGVFLSWLFGILDFRQALWVLVAIAGIAAAPTIVTAIWGA